MLPCSSIFRWRAVIVVSGLVFKIGVCHLVSTVELDLNWFPGFLMTRRWGNLQHGVDYRSWAVGDIQLGFRFKKQTHVLPRFFFEKWQWLTDVLLRQWYPPGVIITHFLDSQQTWDCPHQDRRERHGDLTIACDIFHTNITLPGGAPTSYVVNGVITPYITPAT